MTGRAAKIVLTNCALLIAGAASWYGPAWASFLGLGELSLVAGLIAAMGALTALEKLYDRLGPGEDHTRPETGNSAPVTPDAASDSR